MKIRIDGRVWLPIAEMGQAMTSELKASLTIKRRLFVVGQPKKFTSEPMELWVEKDGMLGLPRDFFRREAMAQHEVDLLVSSGRVLDALECAYKPWNEEQAKALAVLMDALQGQLARWGFAGGILQAKTGWGKTATVTMLIAILRVTFAVLISNDKLADQWRKDLLTGVPTLRLGTVQQNKCQFGDAYDGTICTMPSLYARTKADAKKPYPAELFTWPGLLVCDEGHRIGAETYSDLVSKFTARTRLMATATPRRSDGCERTFFDHIGQILFKGEVEYLKAAVQVNEVDVETPWSKTKKLANGEEKEGVELHESKVMAWLRRQHVFMDRLYVLLRAALAAGRYVLVLTQDIDFLKAIHDAMKDDDLEIGICAGSWPDEKGMNRLVSRERFTEGLTKRLVLSTFGMFKEGISVDMLDTLFVLSPQGDIEQAAGRILRKTIKAPNKRPVIVEFKFKDLLWQRRLEKRLKYYRDKEYKVGRGA